MTALLGTLIIILLVYAFQGLFAFPFWFLGFLVRIIFYPIEIINQVIYPVGSLPYIVVLAFIFYIIFKLIINFFNHKQ